MDRCEPGPGLSRGAASPGPCSARDSASEPGWAHTRISNLAPEGVCGAGEGQGGSGGACTTECLSMCREGGGSRALQAMARLCRQLLGTWDPLGRGSPTRLRDLES